MAWGMIELEDEVVQWIDGLADEAFGQAERYIDLLAEKAMQRCVAEGHMIEEDE